MSNLPLKKVIIPAAGWGTRFLPYTKATPKEMLPIIDKPVIHYVIEQVIKTGIKDIVLVTGYHKRAIEDYFDRNLELESFLVKHKKTEERETIKKIAEMANFIYVRQKDDRYGNAVPVLSAAHVISEDYFGVVWGDEFILSEPPHLAQILEVFKKHPGIVLTMIELKNKELASRYGIADCQKIEEGVFKVKRIVEKPAPEEAPSNYAVIGGYILPREILDILKKLPLGKDNELWLVDGINKAIELGIPAYGCLLKNFQYYDTGNKLEYIKTIIDIALKSPEYSQSIKEFLKKII